MVWLSTIFFSVDTHYIIKRSWIRFGTTVYKDKVLISWRGLGLSKDNRMIMMLKFKLVDKSMSSEERGRVDWTRFHIKSRYKVLKQEKNKVWIELLDKKNCFGIQKLCLRYIAPIMIVVMIEKYKSHNKLKKFLKITKNFSLYQSETFSFDWMIKKMLYNSWWYKY